MILRWSEQDQRGRKLKQQLFSTQPDLSTPTKKNEEDIYVSSTTTLTLLPSDELIDQAKTEQAVSTDWLCTK